MSSEESSSSPSLVPPQDERKAPLPITAGSSPELPDYEEEHAGPSAPSEDRGTIPRHRKRWLRWVLLIIVLMSAPTAYRTLKSWRASMLLAKSESAFAIGDSQRALGLLKQALALSPGSLSVQRTIELYNARSGDKPSLDKLLARMRSGDSDRAELLGIAELEARAGHKESALEALGHLPKKLSSRHTLHLTLIKASIMAREGDLSQAAALCLSTAPSLGGEESGRLRTQGALYLLSQNDPAQIRPAAETLLAVARDRSPASLNAWRLLARLTLQASPDAGPVLDPKESQGQIALLSKLTGALFSDRLLAADLEIKSDPKLQKTVVERLTNQSRGASQNEMLEFARWLNSKGLHAEVVAFAGTERPRNDTAWLLVVLDAQSAQGDWSKISTMLDSPAASGLPDAVRHLFLARAAMMTGNQALAEEEWRNVGGSLNLEKQETLQYVAGYEEQIGAYDRAARTYREMADRKETKTAGMIGIIRCQSRSTPAASIIPLYEELLTGAPDFPEAVGDLAYLKLLVGQDIPQASANAESLLAAHPNMLARISAAALARLRMNDPKGALALYDGKEIDWASAPEPWKAVRCAVLRASGDTAGANQLASGINASALRPEERELLVPAAKQERK